MTITNKTTVKQLIEMGVTLNQIEALVVKAQRGANKSKINEGRESFMEEVFELMMENPENAWKNGMILKNWFAGPSKDVEVENARKQKHAEISRALSKLAESGRIMKHNKTNTSSGVYYTVIKALPMLPDNDGE